MTTLVGTQDSFVDALKNLVELDYAAIAAYEEAISHLKDEECKSKLKEFKEDHGRHVKELNDVLHDLEKEIPKGAGIKQLFTQGKVMFANLIGDKAILKALKMNEDDTNTAYERLNAHPNKSAYATDPLKRGLDDERRHRAWLIEKIQSFEYA